MKCPVDSLDLIMSERSGVDRRPDDRRRVRPRYDQPRYDDRRRPTTKEGWLGELFDF